MKNSIRLDELSVKPSYVDIKKGVKLPTEYSEGLAYFCGILAGDGHIELNLNKRWYRVNCGGNPADEKDLYFFVLSPLIKNLFNVEIKPRSLHNDTFGFELGSKLLATFLTKLLGLPANNKYSQLSIPLWVKQKESFLKAYIRGLADTDFCICLKKRYKKEAYYPVISCASKSKTYMEEIAVALEAFGFKVSRSFNVVDQDSRYKNGFCVTHRIHIYGPTQLILWMKIIGFNSPKHLNKFELWKNRNLNSNRLKVKKALKDAGLIKIEGWQNQPP